MENSHLVTAADMARAYGVDLKQFRAALRRANLEWQSPNDRWEVLIDSPQHEDMRQVLVDLSTVVSVRRRSSSPGTVKSPPKPDDESYVIDLCDLVLGQTALRQYRFSFLRGDPGASGRQASLPVDAYYPQLNLVVEYHERQHTEPVKLFDKRETVSGV